MSDLFTTLDARGFVQDATPACAERLRRGPITAYIGFDPTGDSLHVGHLVAVMGLAWLQRCGGTPIALVGGGTAMVGDPSGKRTERPILSIDQIDANVRSLQAQLGRFLRFEGAGAAQMRNNADWLRNLPLMEFLRDTGKHFTVNYMLQKDSVRSRMESGISFTEFTYMLVQAYDFWHLHTEAGCELQMGGSDQWGNITAGTELIGRKTEGAAVHGLVFPLLTTSNGEKFGKSEGGAVWLDADKTSPYQFYQFWLNVDDADVEKSLKLFTFLELDGIAELMESHRADPGTRAAQRRLALEVTAIVHGDATAKRVIEVSKLLFGGGDPRTADSATLAALAAEIPSAPVAGALLDAGLPMIDALVLSGLATSKADARRGLQGKGFSLNGEQIGEVERMVTSADVLPGGHVLLQKGKKTYAMLVLSGAQTPLPS